MKIKKKNILIKLLALNLKKNDKKPLIKKIEKDFNNHNIKISYKEIEFKVKDFQIKANILVENKFKLNNWR